jgi:predicted nucleotidyltransferase
LTGNRLYDILVLQPRIFDLLTLGVLLSNHVKLPISREGHILEGHYLETTDGLFFAVKGLVHPPERFVACLRYVPDPINGERGKEGLRYHRLYHFGEQEQLLREQYPHYLAFDPICQVTLQSVPRQYLQQIYDPYSCLQQLLRKEDLSLLEQDALDFARLLQQEATVPLTSLGLSGSLLIGLCTPNSDLDLQVSGVQNAWAVQRALKRLLADGASGVRCLDEQGVQELYASRVADTRMSFSDFVGSEREKVIQGQFRDRPYFIRFLKAPTEVDEKYGDRLYSSRGRVGIDATVTDASEAIFTPCRYAVDKVRFLGDSQVECLSEIVSFRGRFCEQALAGDVVRVSGTLERVQVKDGRSWHRLLLGNHPEDTMLVRR